MINETVAKYYELTINDMMQKTNKRRIVKARQVSMYFHKQMTKLSLAEIGVKVGFKDHSTVLDAIRKVNGYIEVDNKFKKEIDEIQALLYGFKIIDNDLITNEYLLKIGFKNCIHFYRIDYEKLSLELIKYNDVFIPVIIDNESATNLNCISTIEELTWLIKFIA